MGIFTGSTLLNYEQEALGRMQIPGPRINPNLIKDLEESPDNILFLEKIRAQQIYAKIVQMAQEGYIKKGHDLGLAKFPSPYCKT